MTPPSLRHGAGLAGLLLALALAACATDGIGFGTSPQAAAPPPAPPVEMVGRWMLSSPGAGQCGMNFRGTAGAMEGTIAPEGGCPGNFFTSRKWAFEEKNLVIRDHTGKPLAQLAVSTPGQFAGQAVSGEAISLTR